MLFVMIVVVFIIFLCECGKYMGVVGGIMVFGIIGGLLFGGFFIDVWGWCFNFFVGVLFVIFVFVLL